jgi:hypothetical protein
MTLDAAARPARRQVERTIERDFSIAIESQAWIETRGVAVHEERRLGRDDKRVFTELASAILRCSAPGHRFRFSGATAAVVFDQSVESSLAAAPAAGAAGGRAADEGGCSASPSSSSSRARARWGWRR